MIQLQLLLNIEFDEDGDYRILAETNLPDDAFVRKVLVDALALMGGDPVKESNTSTYRATTPENHKAGLYWPDQ